MTGNSSTTATGRLDTGGAAGFLGVSESLLNRMRSEGRGPRYIRLGGRIFYRQADLDAYVDSGVVETTDSRKAAANTGRAA